MLGINPSTLRSRMEKLGIKKPGKTLLRIRDVKFAKKSLWSAGFLTRESGSDVLSNRGESRTRMSALHGRPKEPASMSV